MSILAGVELQFDFIIELKCNSMVVIQKIFFIIQKLLFVMNTYLIISQHYRSIYVCLFVFCKFASLLWFPNS